MANISLDFKYYLTNVKWTNEYKNVLCFADKAARDTYFDLATIFAGITDTVNFNITNLYKTTIVIDSADYITALQSNYIIINDSVKNAYYFYFITNARQCNFNRIELNIELDVFQQYWYDTTFVDSNIRRCKYPINKKTTWSNNNVLNNQNPLCYLSEPFTFETPYKKSTDMLIQDGVFSITTMPDLVSAWMYVFVDPSYEFAGKDIDNGTDITLEFSGYTTCPTGTLGEGSANNIGVMVFPIYNSSSKFRIHDSTNNTNYDLTDAAIILDEIMSGHSDADGGHIYSIKISRRPPFRSRTHFTGTPSTANFDTTSAGNFRLLSSFYDTPACYATALFRVGSYYGLRFVLDTIDSYIFTCAADASILSDGTVEHKFNPALKLANAQFTPTYIDFGDGNKFEIDYTKARSINSPYIKFKYREPITPDITRYSVCMDNSDWYSGDNNDGDKYSTTSFTADMSMIFTLDQWAQYLANNKNFYEQGKFNTLIATSKNYLGGAISAGKLDFVGAAASLAGGVLDAYAFTKNRDYQIDNKKAAVDTVVNQNGSAIANLLIKGIMPSVVIYQIKSADITRATQYMKMYGVNTNGFIANVKNNGLLSSAEFKYAYMQADVNEISSGTMSLECEKKLLKIFNDGVRLWFDPDTMYDFNS